MRIIDGFDDMRMGELGEDGLLSFIDAEFIEREHLGDEGLITKFDSIYSELCCKYSQGETTANFVSAGSVFCAYTCSGVSWIGYMPINYILSIFQFL